MEHSCPRCNSSVDDNSPFCPTCEAAQVRATAKEYSSSPINVMVETTPVFLDVAQSPPISRRGESHIELRSALYAGVAGALLSMTHPLASFMAFPFVGFLSVVLFRRRSRISEPMPRVGFRIGALTGLFAFGLLTVYTAAGTLALHDESSVHAAMIKMVQQAESRNADPKARQRYEYLMTPEGMTFLMSFRFVLGCVFFVLLSGIGGLISASLLRRKAPPGE